MNDRILLAFEDAPLRRTSFLSQLKDTLRQMPKLRKRLFYWRVALFFACVIVLTTVCLRSVWAQPGPIAPVPVITVKDALQDERIENLTEFRHNQENYNRQMAETIQHELDAQSLRIEENTKAIATQSGWFTGALALLTLINGVTAFKTLKPKS